jgi:hypothetical protein
MKNDARHSVCVAEDHLPSRGAVHHMEGLTAGVLAAEPAEETTAATLHRAPEGSIRPAPPQHRGGRLGGLFRRIEFGQVAGFHGQVRVVRWQGSRRVTARHATVCLASFWRASFWHLFWGAGRPFRLVSARFGSFRLVSARFGSFRLVSARFGSFSSNLATEYDAKYDARHSVAITPGRTLIPPLRDHLYFTVNQRFKRTICWER